MRSSTLLPAVRVTAYVYLGPAFVALSNGATFEEGISLSVLVGIVFTMSVTILLQGVELPA
jgi:Na+/H+ antiporter NhaA